MLQHGSGAIRDLASHDPQTVWQTPNLTTDPYTPTPLKRSSPIRGSGNNRTCTSTAMVPYAPQPGHLAHPPLLFAWSISRSGKSHALMSRPQIVARLINPPPSSAATARHRNHLRGSDTASPQPVHLPGARSCTGSRTHHGPTTTPSSATSTRITRGYTHRSRIHCQIVITSRSHTSFCLLLQPRQRPSRATSHTRHSPLQGAHCGQVSRMRSYPDHISSLD